MYTSLDPEIAQRPRGETRRRLVTVPVTVAVVFALGVALGIVLRLTLGLLG